MPRKRLIKLLEKVMIFFKEEFMKKSFKNPDEFSERIPGRIRGKIL